jgi:hypothetical protein
MKKTGSGRERKASVRSDLYVISFADAYLPSRHPHINSRRYCCFLRLPSAGFGASFAMRHRSFFTAPSILPVTQGNHTLPFFIRFFDGQIIHAHVSKRVFLIVLQSVPHFNKLKNTAMHKLTQVAILPPPFGLWRQSHLPFLFPSLPDKANGFTRDD